MGIFRVKINISKVTYRYMTFSRHLLVLASFGVLAAGIYAIPAQTKKATKLKKKIDFNRDNIFMSKVMRTSL